MRQKPFRKATRKEVAINLLYLFGSLSLIFGTVLFILWACGPSKPLPEVELPDSVESVSVPKSLRKHIHIVCLGGFEYFYAKWDDGMLETATGYSILAPRFSTTNSLPVPCRVEKP